MRGSTAVFALPFLICSLATHATTWTPPSPEPDPILDGATCMVSKPMSSGSYIYAWPSKYDQVFWPMTTLLGIWFCESSGFTAFVGDFELGPGEKAAVQAHLAKVSKPTGKPDTRELLDLLRESYAARTTDKAFKIQLLRVLAYLNDAELQDYEAAGRFRKQALAMIDEELATGLDEGHKLEYLFVTAAYQREFGEIAKSNAALEQLKAALKSSSDEKLSGFVEYLTGLASDIPTIEPGGALAPTPQPESEDEDIDD